MERKMGEGRENATKTDNIDRWKERWGQRERENATQIHTEGKMGEGRENASNIVK